MEQIVYVSDSMRQSANFINNLVSDLQRLGIEIAEHNRKYNFIIVGGMEIRGITVYNTCSAISRNYLKYFIDGIDMRNYKDASKERIDSLIWHIKDVMLHFREDTKQLSGKDELIKILAENNAEVKQ